MNEHLGMNFIRTTPPEFSELPEGYCVRHGNDVATFFPYHALPSRPPVIVQPITWSVIHGRWTTSGKTPTISRRLSVSIVPDF